MVKQLSLLAETVDEYIKLEFARRRNQTHIRRRSSVLELFPVAAAPTRLKERQSQVKHHEFLLRTENKAAIEALVDRVRDLAEFYSSAPMSANLKPFSPMEKSRFSEWANGVEKLLHDFEPSDNHDYDPIVRLLMQLQFLQEGHVCLAEVAVDARALLERWERDGVFDSDVLGEHDEDDERDEEELPAKSQWTNSQKNSVEHSYAYQSLRERAAANVIKRSVLRWARSLESMQHRVDELELFGKTTESFMAELTNISNMQRLSATNNNIFDLVKVRRDNMYANSIFLADLVQFSKHVALFSVDEAVRRVDEIELKRFLFETRCVLKIQTLWRKTRQSVKGRRMMRVVEALRVQCEQEEQQRQLAKHQKAIEGGADSIRRMSRTPKRPNKFLATPPSLPSSRRSFRGEDFAERRTSSTSSGQKRSLSMNGRRKESKNILLTSTDRNDSTGQHLGLEQARQPRRRYRESLYHIRTADDEDHDDRDVEAAWQSFLDSTTLLETDVNLPPADAESIEIPAEALEIPQPVNDVGDSAVMPSLTQEDWRSWSDDEESADAARKDDEQDAQQLLVSTNREDDLSPEPLSTPPKTLITPMKITVTVIPSGVTSPRETGNDEGAKNDEGTKSGEDAKSIEGTQLFSKYDRQSSMRSSDPLPKTHRQVTIQKHVNGKYSNAGRLNVMSSFATRDVDTENEVQQHTSPVSTRKHLYDMDFGNIDKKTAALLFADPLVPNESDGFLDKSIPQDTSKHIEKVRPSVRGARMNKVKQLRSAITKREEENHLYPPKKSRNQQHWPDTLAAQMDTDAVDQANPGYDVESSESKRFIYPMHDIDIRKELVMRDGVRISSSHTLSTDTHRNMSPDAQVKFNNQGDWFRSVGLDTGDYPTPHRPISNHAKLYASYRKRAKGKPRAKEENQIEPTLTTRREKPWKRVIGRKASEKLIFPHLQPFLSAELSETKMEQSFSPMLPRESTQPTLTLPKLSMEAASINRSRQTLIPVALLPEKSTAISYDTSEFQTKVDHITIDHKHVKNDIVHDIRDESAAVQSESMTVENAEWKQHTSETVDDKWIDITDENTSRSVYDEDGDISDDESMYTESEADAQDIEADVMTDVQRVNTGEWELDETPAPVREYIHTDQKHIHSKVTSRKMQQGQRKKKKRSQAGQENDDQCNLVKDVDGLIVAPTNKQNMSNEYSTEIALKRKRVEHRSRNGRQYDFQEILYEDEVQQAEATTQMVTIDEKELHSVAKFQHLLTQYLGLLQCTPSINSSQLRKL